MKQLLIICAFLFLSGNFFTARASATDPTTIHNRTSVPIILKFGLINTAGNTNYIEIEVDAHSRTKYKPTGIFTGYYINSVQVKLLNGNFANPNTNPSVGDILETSRNALETVNKSVYFTINPDPHLATRIAAVVMEGTSGGS